MMEKKTIEYINTLIDIDPKTGWKKALDSFFVLLRKQFVFDNLSVYLDEHKTNIPEIVYARSMGRGRSAEADATWGETIANQIMTKNSMIQETPKEITKDRVEMPYLLGLPLPLHRGQGALIFVRFGGPKYEPAHKSIAKFAAYQVARLFERRSLEILIQQLESAKYRAQLQDDFIATISHDLHTPLGCIKGYVTSLLRVDTKWDSKTQQEFLSIIDEESDYLISLIDQLLDSARIKTGVLALDFQPIRLDRLIKDASTRVCNREKSLQVELELEPSPLSLFDATRMAQVLNNLFDNAVKHAPGANINIKLNISNEKYVLVFSDNGPGIASEHLPLLFERFYRIADQSRVRGTGLGLFICREIIQAHNGKISVESKPGQGTSFTISIPVLDPDDKTGMMKQEEFSQNKKE